MGSSGSKPPKQTVGYKYEVGIHMMIVHGPIDGVKQIWVGEKVTWPDASDSTVLQADGAILASIDENNLFGGDDREGGIVGEVDIAYGGAIQTTNSYLVSQLDPTNGFIPAFRGLVGIILKKVYVGTSAYIKPWSFLCKRTDVLNDGNIQWYLTKADINGDLNPAHIIRECLTNVDWGMGYGTGFIGDTFIDAADTLYTENFGLSFLWQSTSTIEEFILMVVKHIDAFLFQDQTTGKFELVLARENYTPATLDIYDENDLTEVLEFRRDTYGEIPNQVIVKYSDVPNDKDATVTLHDIAVVDLQGGNLIPKEFKYTGITKAALANVVCSRELRQMTSMLARMTLKGPRNLSSLRPGDVIKINWSNLGITEMIVRVITVNYGSLTDGSVTINVIEDVFNAASALYSDPPDTDWISPVNDPQEALDQVLFEIPYWTIAKSFPVATVEALDNDAGFLAVGAVKATGDTLDYELYLRNAPAGDLLSWGWFDFTPSGTLSANLSKNHSDAVITLNDPVDLIAVNLGTYAILNNEILKVKTINTTTSVVTLARGVLDTKPQAHLEDNRIFFVDSAGAFITREYTVTEQPGVKILPQTSKGQLAIGDATAYSVDAFTSRMIRPYLPSYFRIDGQSYPSSFAYEPILTWLHRDRIEQLVDIIEQSEASIGPEATATYTLRINDESDVLKRTETGLSGTGYTYSEADERSDCGLATASVGSPIYASGNAGNGTLGSLSIGGSYPYSEIVTVVCTLGGGSGVAKFLVSGENESAAYGIATSNVAFNGPYSLNFLISVGGINWQIGDEISFVTIAGDPLNTSLRFRLKTVRGGYDSYQEYDLTVNRSTDFG